MAADIVEKASTGIYIVKSKIFGNGEYSDLENGGNDELSKIDDSKNRLIDI